jgi:hypothetical protein
LTTTTNNRKGEEKAWRKTYTNLRSNHQSALGLESPARRRVVTIYNNATRCDDNGKRPWHWDLEMAIMNYKSFSPCKD